ncbi:MAG: prolyl oligopeptidase family serine peptidase [Thermoanaerobaculia bacterium]|nr:prolyl oligopeptidase family serine peptidase [Thermoanaerobaculia bacterium]
MSNFHSKIYQTLLVTLLLVVAVSGGPAKAEENGYQLPPQPLVDLVEAAPTPWVVPSADRTKLLVYDWRRLTTLEELARPELGLAGMRIDPQARGPSRTVPYVGMRVLDIETGELKAVEGLPESPALTRVGESPGGRYASMVHTHAEGIELWLVDLESCVARQLTGPILNQTFDVPPQWLDASTILVRLAPETQEPPPQESRVPAEPVIQESLGKESASRTFQNLLSSPHDEALWEHYFRGQLAKVSLDGTVTRIGPEAIHLDWDPSPDGRYILVETLHSPWSYEVFASRFPRKVQLWSPAGELVRELLDSPLQDTIPNAFGSVAQGPRSHQWRSDADATLIWAEAQDGGDARVDAEVRDRVYQLAAPFDGEPKKLADLSSRFRGVDAGNGELMFVYGLWWRTQKLQTWRLAPDADDPSPVLIEDRSYRDYYGDPGSVVTIDDTRGQNVVQTTSDGHYFLVGSGASDDGEQPFLDRVDPKTGEVARIFQSKPTETDPFYERPVLVLDGEGTTLVTRRESPEETPNFFVRDLGSTDNETALRRLTDFDHPTPQLKGISKELIHYKRADGVELTGTLYLPAGHDAEKDGPLPLLMWAYPIEIQDPSLAGQVTGSPFRFDLVRPSSPLLWLARGYAVLDDPQMPIVAAEGDEEPNDRFVGQLVASAQAAVDAVVDRGVTAPGRIAIGGHSYGAFMTANLLAHSELFAAGIAQSGAYNRTLTPFGFQAEERSLWQAPEIYFAMSPFMHAEKVDEPILIVHGQADDNPGTFPIQSERFYEAVKGHSGTARLVMLPLEGHGYRAVESRLHLMWEIDRWLGQYLSEEDSHQADHTPGAPSSSAAGEGGS